jgi:hypothetical protein
VLTPGALEEGDLVERVLNLAVELGRSVSSWRTDLKVISRRRTSAAMWMTSVEIRLPPAVCG